MKMEEAISYSDSASVSPMTTTHTEAAGHNTPLPLPPSPLPPCLSVIAKAVSSVLPAFAKRGDLLVVDQVGGPPCTYALMAAPVPLPANAMDWPMRCEGDFNSDIDYAWLDN